MSRKFRKNISSKSIAQIRAIETKLKEEKTILRKDEQLLSQTDRLVWAYKEIKTKNGRIITEIVTVAYVTNIEGKEYTIVHYDNVHDEKLHMHLYNSIQDPSDIIIPLKFLKDKNQARLLRWAIKEVRNKWYYLRRKYYKRSGLSPEF